MVNFENDNLGQEHKPEEKASILPQEHIDQWAELAVDYLDGKLDPQSQAAVEAHLLECADCARRLDEQRKLVKQLRQTPLAEPPAWLENAVLEQILPAPIKEAAYPRKTRESAWTRFWKGTLRPWAPAAVAVAVILLGIVTYGVLRGTAQEFLPHLAEESAPAASEPVASSVAATPKYRATDTGAEATAASASQEDTSAGVLSGGQNETTTTALAGVAPSSSLPLAATSATSVSVSTSTTYRALEPPILLDSTDNKRRVIDILKTTNTPAHFVFFSSSSDRPLTIDKAAAVAEQLRSLTGLEPLAISLSSAGPTLAAYLPHEDAAPFVDLLLSIAASLELSLSLELEPPERESAAYAALMEHKNDVAQLVARRAPSPGVSEWTFTTSTLLAPEEQSNHALVVIFARQ